MAVEEPSNPEIPEVEEPASADDPTPEGDNSEPARAASEGSDDPKAKREAALSKLPAVLREAFGEDPDDEEDEAVAAGLTAERIRSLDPVARVALRAATRRLDAAEAKLKADAEAAAKAQREASAKLDADAKALRQREAALLALARSDAAADPGAEPDVDPFTPEGAKKLAEYHGRRAAAEGLAPLRQRAVEVDRQARWQALVDEYPDLADPKVSGEGGEFTVYLAKLNEGIDPTKERPRVPTEIAAKLFFGDKARQKLEQQVRERKAREAADRATSARALARSGSGGGGPSAIDRYRTLKKTDPDAALALLESDPNVRREVLGAAGIV